MNPPNPRPQTPDPESSIRALDGGGAGWLARLGAWLLFHALALLDTLAHEREMIRRHWLSSAPGRACLRAHTHRQAQRVPTGRDDLGASGVCCPKCGAPGAFIRDRHFQDGSGKVFMCETEGCAGHRLYFYPPSAGRAQRVPTGRDDLRSSVLWPCNGCGALDYEDAGNQCNAGAVCAANDQQQWWEEHRAESLPFAARSTLTATRCPQCARTHAQAGLFCSLDCERAFQTARESRLPISAQARDPLQGDTTLTSFDHQIFPKKTIPRVAVPAPALRARRPR